MQGEPTNSASSALKKKHNSQQLQPQPSPTSVRGLTIDVNSPTLDQHPSQPSSADSKSKRSRRRRKAKARGNQVEPISSPSRSYNTNHSKNKSNYNNSYNNSNSGQRQESSSSFRSPIVTWRTNRPRNNKSNNSNRYNTNPNRHNGSNSNSNNKQWNQSSPRFSKNVNNQACPASTGFPTSKKQHDAPMKKRDLYFALDVERVGIAPPPDNQSQQQQKAVARVTLTNWENEIVLDTFVVIPVPVTDFYETGIRPEHVMANTTSTGTIGSAGTEGAEESSRSFAAVRAKIEGILRGKILIGYDLDECLQALGLMHPNTDTRDCSAYFPDQGKSAISSLASLEQLSRKELNRWSVKASKIRVAKDTLSNEVIVFSSKDPSISKIPVLVCVTSMDLYKKHRNKWETTLITQARERERQQQEHLLKISQQRQQEQQQAQQQYRENITAISMHCETVRTALSGRTKTLARVTIVDGPSRNILLDEFCQIHVPVTDFCETGITALDVQVARNKSDPSGTISAKPLSLLRAHVEKVLRGRLLVGYKVEDALKALGLSHPWAHIRDTAFFPIFLHNKMVGGSTSVVTVRSLEELSEEFLRQKLRSLGDRSRPADLCRTALGLYETVRDQWEHNQRDTYLQHPQQAHNLHVQQPGRMIPRSPSASSTGMLQSPHHHNNQQQQPNHYYGHQSGMTSYGESTMTPSPSQQQQYQQQRAMEQQQEHPDMQSRSNSSSWFPWGKQQPQQQNQVGAVSQMLSPQAYQVLQEVSGGQASSSSTSNNSFFRDNFSVSSYFGESSYADGTSRYEESTIGGVSESSNVNSEDFASESVISSLPDEASSVISSDQAPSIAGSPTLVSQSYSSSSSSWFRFGSKKSKYPTPDGDAKTSCETMAAVQEMEVLNDDGMLPTPVTLFPPSQDMEGGIAKSQQQSNSTEKRHSEATTEESSMSPSLSSRNWFGFRKSSNSPGPGGKDRSHSPSSLQSVSTIEDLSISAQPEGFPDTATEASIEITLSIPVSGDSSDLISTQVKKPATTTLPCRPSSSSWFGFRRSSKSSGSKSSNFQSDSLPKGPTQLEIPHHPGLPSAPTERTATMDDDWLQEVMTGAPNDLDPWLNEKEQAKPGENTEKSSSTSRGQASWFGFKRSKATSSNKVTPLTNLDSSIDGTYIPEDPYEDNTWESDAPTDSYWLSESSNAPISGSDEKNNLNENDHDNNEIFRRRPRLATESTIPSVTTEGPSEEESSISDGCSKDFDFGAVQSFNFLKI
mmetsp:Transcript_9588/g.18830  ORF Transcript_9588/g.18830 Transcript_9588/m.18830 type:complete len:1254 (+) Transcript_9588:195-3956(+)|eukprot:CAMPEP_0168184256 /NCGR_PEP_ID=MMETSP0139_2-20121125/13117_1 /TAXON_ID=44445 /ORGANISM="Pseudo-nitzschia australis, Strain 10249 10 AB" /LENGTH=1253 /DNA_ID=CAMNT_0008105815 /DNA_START=564 /DNA_END=4325 /DNA_ORIENTATION=+